MAWFILIIAGIFEAGWTLGLKTTEGFTRPLPSLLTITAIVVSMVLLAQATRALPIGSAYSVWVGLGVLGATLGGHLLFGEPLPPLRLAFVGLLLVALVGLKWTSPSG